MAQAVAESDIDLLQPQVRRMVANSIPGLTTDRVTVVFVPATAKEQKAANAKHVMFLGMAVDASSVPQLRGLLFGGGWLGVQHTFASSMAQNFWMAIFAFTGCFLGTLAALGAQVFRVDAQRITHAGTKTVRLDQHRDQHVDIFHTGTQREVAQRLLFRETGAQLDDHHLQFLRQDRLFAGVTFSFAALVLLTLFGILVSLFVQAWPCLPPPLWPAAAGAGPV